MILPEDWDWVDLHCSLPTTPCSLLTTLCFPLETRSTFTDHYPPLPAHYSLPFVSPWRLRLGRPSLITTHHSLLTTHYLVFLPEDRDWVDLHCSLPTTSCSLLTTLCFPLETGTRSTFTAHYTPLPAHYSLPCVSPLRLGLGRPSILTNHHSLLTTHYLVFPPGDWVDLQFSLPTAPCSLLTTLCFCLKTDTGSTFTAHYPPLPAHYSLPCVSAWKP